MIGIKYVLAWLFFVYALFSFAVPGGKLFDINIKLSLFFLIVVFFVLTIINHPQRIFITPKHAFIGMILSLCFLVGVVVGFTNNDVLLVLDDFILTFSPILLFFLFFIVFRNDNKFAEEFIKYAVLGVLVFNLAKLIFVIYFFQGVELADIEDLTKWYGGRVPVYSKLPFDLVRLYWTELDFVSIGVAFVLFVFKLKGLSNKIFLTVFYAIFLIGLLIAFSRALFGIFVILAIVGMVLRYGKIKFALIVLPLLLLLITQLDESFFTLIEHRFSSSYIKSADDVRFKQIESLLSRWDENPIFGIGFGGSAELLRSVEKPYQYEIWWLALFMKLGLFGILMFLILVFVPLVWLFSQTKRSVGMSAILLLYYTFIIASFTNQYFPTSIAGVFMIFMYCSMLVEVKKQTS